MIAVAAENLHHCSPSCAETGVCAKLRRSFGAREEGASMRPRANLPLMDSYGAWADFVCDVYLNILARGASLGVCRPREGVGFLMG